MEKLYRLGGKEKPAHCIIKDVFEYIDKRRDGVIDLREWMDAFLKYENPI